MQLPVPPLREGGGATEPRSPQEATPVHAPSAFLGGPGGQKKPPSRECKKLLKTSSKRSKLREAA
eukprot:9223827-Alexandrium_andersonii.AAC.1